ncbi:GNAT family N-acetyltransferase [Puerhibacterium sp. TATVAM-FAB25]|uniref:GNAT family N-acetyltransferase n=1 Tax=Puerhibacterium sp. TATVAM-FAB25 TaxID=3093699 RepID=UPI003979F266
MTTAARPAHPTAPVPVVVPPATPDDHEALTHLWQLFRHDLSAVTGALPDRRGRFRDERLRAALDGAPGWQAHVLRLGDAPAGFALVRGLDGGTRVLSAFFVVAAARRRGVGLAAASVVLAAHPGPWEVAFQDANAPAVAFWRRVATTAAGEAWTEERRPVPGRPDLPPDVWIHIPA